MEGSDLMPKVRLTSFEVFPCSLWVAVEGISVLNAVWELGWNPIVLILSTQKQWLG